MNVERQAAQPPPNFANPAAVVQSWYVAARSRDVARGAVRSFDLLNRRIAVYRDDDGVARAVDAHCPHLGADLGEGSVEGAALRCAFHGWLVGPHGDCTRPGRAYPVVERWGVIWIFNGPEPLFGLPAPPEGEPCRVFRLPRQRIRCHPHLVIANGLDVSHYASLHEFVSTETPHFTAEGPHRLSLELRGRPASRLHRLLAGCETRDVAARFTTIGASLAWVTVREPVRFHALFSGRPAPGGGCETQTLLFLPRRGAVGLTRAAAIMYLLLRDDRRILDGLRFTPNFTQADMPLKSFARVVNALETW